MPKSPQSDHFYAPGLLRKTGCTLASAADTFSCQQVTDCVRGHV